MKHELRLFLLSGSVAAHLAAGQESASPHAAEGMWFGAHVDDIPCDSRSSVPLPGQILPGVTRFCGSTTTLYVLEVAVHGEEAVATLTTGRAPSMSSYSAMQRVLQGRELEAPRPLELTGAAEGNSLSIAMANDIVVIEAMVKRDRMDATIASDTADGEQAVRFERCVPDTKSRRAATECSIDALWRRLAEESSETRMRSPMTSISRMPPSLGQQTPFPSSPR